MDNPLSVPYPDRLLDMGVPTRCKKICQYSRAGSQGNSNPPTTVKCLSGGERERERERERVTRSYKEFRYPRRPYDPFKEGIILLRK